MHKRYRCIKSVGNQSDNKIAKAERENDERRKLF